MKAASTQSYRVGIYLRLSHGSQETEDSIKNQEQYITNYLAEDPTLQAVDVYADEGYSGTNFERPEFSRMLADVQAGKINCIIVKDLSRLGRNYIETGRYLERYFPLLNVRFIAINDGYDSLSSNTANAIIVPFKNLVNDAYCHDISVKIKSHLDVKMKNGEFIGAFAVYGYQKSQDNKNRLVVDEPAARAVKDIFRMYLNGSSSQKIAEMLNTLGVPSPLQYKKNQGMRYTTPFQIFAVTKWTAAAVGRILQNEVYTGTLLQGRQRTLSHRRKLRLRKNRADWIRCESSHRAIISCNDFLLVQTLRQAMHNSPSLDPSQPLNGILLCQECNSKMVRQIVPGSGSKRYTYQVCSGHKRNKQLCTSHRINEPALMDAVLAAVNQQLSGLLQNLSIDKDIHLLCTNEMQGGWIEKRIQQLRTELHQYERWSQELSGDFQEGILTQDEVQLLEKRFYLRRQEILLAIEQNENELQRQQRQNKAKRELLTDIYRQKEVRKITREIVVFFISQILVDRELRIHIRLRYKQPLWLCEGSRTDGSEDSNLRPDFVR